MKNKINLKTLMFICALLFSIEMGNAQIEVKWKINTPSKVLWQQVSSLGNLIVSTEDALERINEETGEIVWTKKEFSNLARNTYQELPNSPFFSIKNDKGFFLIDQFSGDEVFNSVKAGVASIKDYYFLYNSDAILVAGTDKTGSEVLVSVKMSEGKLLWSMNEKFGRIVAVNELNNNEILIVTLFNNYKLNANDGSIIWKKDVSAEAAQLKKMGGFGNMLKAVAAEAVKDEDIKLNFYRKPGDDVFYLGSQQEDEMASSSSSGNPTIIYSNSYSAYKISDGSFLWDTPLQVKGKLGHVVFRNNGLLILPDDGNRTKINLFNYETKEGLWGKKGKGIAIKGGVYDYMESGDAGILLVSRTSSNNFLNYLDAKNGVITFDKPVKVNGSVVGIVPLTNSILYITTESMNILDISTGELKWKKDIKTKPELTAEHDGKIYAFDLKEALVKVIDKQTEEVKELSSSPIAFQGKEEPQKIEVLANGIFLHSDQNVVKIGFDGKVLFQEYYPALREAGWKRALLYASAIRAAYIGANAYYVSGSIARAENDIRQEDEFSGELAHQIGNAYGELGDAASSYAVSAVKQANARMKATKSGRDFMFIMSKVDDTNALLKVSKSTGKVDGKITLGEDREPNYAIDDITGQVYYLTGENELTSYQVK